MTSNAERAADALAAEGVTQAFGLMGNGNLELIAALVDRVGLRYLSARHESGAVAAADGFARAGGGLGVALVTHGPGLTNAATALITARRARSPVLVVAGDASGYAGRSTQRLDQRRFAAGIDLPLFSPAAGEDWAVVARAAAAEARRTGAVLLNLPAEVLSAASAETGTLPPAPSPASPEPIDGASLERLLRIIAAAERPLVLAGRGVRLAGQGRAARDVALQLGAPIGTSLGARGLTTCAAGDIGLIGGLASAESQAACADCDLLIALGASLNGFTTEHATLFPKASVVRLDADPAAPSSLPVAEKLSGALEATLPALRDALPSTPRQRWTPHAPQRPVDTVAWPGEVFAALDALLPEARAVIYDHGDMANAAVTSFRAFDETQSLFMPDFGSLGLAIAAATGAAAARPDRISVAVVGDGGLMMSLPDLDMLARSGAPVLVLVMNDRAFGAEIPHLRRIGASLSPATFHDVGPDGIAGIARGIGLHAVAFGPEDGTDALAQAVTEVRTGPVLIEVRCPPPH